MSLGSIRRSECDPGLGRGFEVRGHSSLEHWQRKAKYILRWNRLATFLTAAAFAGPLLKLVGHSSFGFNLVGESGTGISEAVRFAGSVWGSDGDSPLEYCASLPETVQDLDQLWARHANGFLAIATETGTQDGQSRARAISKFLLWLEQKTARERFLEHAQPERGPRLYLLTGSLPTYEGRAGVGSALAESSLGPIELPIFGVRGAFDYIPGGMSQRQFREFIQKSIVTAYGTAIRRFLKLLASESADPENDLAEQLRYAIREFRKEVKAHALAGSPQRVVDCFALVFVAGVLAYRYGVLPVGPGAMWMAAIDCFKAHRHFVNGEIAKYDPVAALRLFINENRATFEDAESGTLSISPRQFRRTKGIRHRSKAGRRLFSFSPERFRRIFRSEATARLAAKTLRVRGLLVAKGDLLQTKIRLRAAGAGDRVYCVRAQILDG